MVKFAVEIEAPAAILLYPILRKTPSSQRPAASSDSPVEAPDGPLPAADNPHPRADRSGWSSRPTHRQHLWDSSPQAAHSTLRYIASGKPPSLCDAWFYRQFVPWQRYCQYRPVSNTESAAPHPPAEAPGAAHANTHRHLLGLAPYFTDPDRAPCLPLLPERLLWPPKPKFLNLLCHPLHQDERRSLALGSRKSRKRKKPTQVQPPLEGAACTGCNRVCFTHPYYNKVEKLVACSIGNNQKIICTFISCNKALNCWLSVLFATNAVDLSSRLLV